MGKHDNKFFVASVVEVIKNNGNPTLELRVRIPTLHGNVQTGLKDSQLPLAKPLLLPGAAIDAATFDTNILGAVVYVILEAGDVTRPMYFGLKGDEADYIEAGVVPYAGETIPGIIRVKKIGNTGYIYTADE